VRGRIDQVRFLGDMALVEIAVEGLSGKLKALVPQGEVPGDAGDVSITIDPREVIVFAAE
jgi:hypothetical protein